MREGERGEWEKGKGVEGVCEERGIGWGEKKETRMVVEELAVSESVEGVTHQGKKVGRWEGVWR